MKNFKQLTASELLFKIEFFTIEVEDLNHSQSRNALRAYLDSAAVLFNLEGYSRTEIEAELKKIIG